MTIDEELSALMDRFFRAVSFADGGTPEYERLHDSPTDSVADVGGLRRVDHPDDLQFDP